MGSRSDRRREEGPEKEEEQKIKKIRSRQRDQHVQRKAWRTGLSTGSSMASSPAA